MTSWFLQLMLLALSSFCISVACFQSGRQIQRLPYPRGDASGNTVLSAKKQGGTANENIVALIHSHHLLDHKPDNLILKGGKFKLRGVGCLGRPGVALCIGPQKAVDKFRSKLMAAMPQKKFGTTKLDCSAIPADELEALGDFEEASLGELRGVLASLGHEDEFFALTGIDPSNAAAISSSEDKGGDSKMAPKKKKEKVTADVNDT